MAIWGWQLWPSGELHISSPNLISLGSEVLEEGLWWSGSHLVLHCLSLFLKMKWVNETHSFYL